MLTDWSETWDQCGRSQLLRLRETHIRDHVAPLLTAGAHGVVKLDLILRGLARNQPEGELPSSVSWARLHDLARSDEFYRRDLRLKRNWVGPKLEQLESLGLLVRTAIPGNRSTLNILADDGSERPLDDPDGSPGSRYLTIPADLIGYGWLREWRSSQLAALFACMVAERFSDGGGIDALKSDLQVKEIGNGLWLRPLRWFADSEGYRPADHVRIPFGERSLQRGMTELIKDGLLVREYVYRNPATGKPFRDRRSRYLYWNQFHDARRERPPHRRQTQLPVHVRRRLMTTPSTNTEAETHGSARHLVQHPIEI